MHGPARGRSAGYRGSVGAPPEGGGHLGELIYRDELLALDGKRNGFELALELTREPARRAGDYSRRIDAAMTSDLFARLSEAQRRVFVCGSNRFVEASTQAAIAADITPSTIRTERYGG